MLACAVCLRVVCSFVVCMRVVCMYVRMCAVCVLEDPLLVMTTASVYLKPFQCLKTSVVTTIAEISPTLLARRPLNVVLIAMYT